MSGFSNPWNESYINLVRLRLNQEDVDRDEGGIDVERIVDGTDTRLNLSFDARNFPTTSWEPNEIGSRSASRGTSNGAISSRAVVLPRLHVLFSGDFDASSYPTSLIHVH